MLAASMEEAGASVEASRRKVLGAAIRRERKKRGWSQRELAEKLHVEVAQTISNWERGQSKPDPDKFAGILKHLSIWPPDILYPNETLPPTGSAPAFQAWLEGMTLRLEAALERLERLPDDER